MDNRSHIGALSLECIKSHTQTRIMSNLITISQILPKVGAPRESVISASEGDLVLHG